MLDGLLQPVIPGFDPFAQAQEQAEGPPAGVTPPLGESSRSPGAAARPSVPSHARTSDLDHHHQIIMFVCGRLLRPAGALGGEGPGGAGAAAGGGAEARAPRHAGRGASSGCWAAIIPSHTTITHPIPLFPIQAGILGQELLLRSSALAAVSSPSPFSLPFGLPAWAAVGLALAPGAVYEGTELLTKGRDGTGGKGPTEFLTHILEQESPDFEAERAAKRERREMESKELNNGRLAMIAVLGMIAQEAATGKALF